jgi:NADPH:quinone reductase-like Zn-dependent oxidoreductase
MFGMLSTLASTPWLQFNPLSLVKANEGVFVVDLAHMWDEIDRVTGWVDQLISLWEQGAIKPKIARIVHFDDAAGAHPAPTTNGRAQTTRAWRCEHAEDECDSR